MRERGSPGWRGQQVTCCLLQVKPGTARKCQRMCLEDRAAVIREASMLVDQLPPGAETDRLLALQQRAWACAQDAQQLAARAAELGVTQYSGSVSTASLSSNAGEEAEGGEQQPPDAGQSQAQQPTQEQPTPQGSRQEQQPAEVGSQMQLSARPGSPPIRLHLQAAAYITALLTAACARSISGAKPAAHAAGPLTQPLNTSAGKCTLHGCRDIGWKAGSALTRLSLLRQWRPAQVGAKGHCARVQMTPAACNPKTPGTMWACTAD